MLCAAPSLHSRHDPVKTPVDLARLPHLLFALQPHDRWILIDRENTRHEIPLAGRFRLNDSEALLAAAVSGLGVALLPSWVAHASLRRGALTQVLPDHDAMFWPSEHFIWAVYPPKRLVPPKVRTFIDRFTAYIGAPPYWASPAARHSTRPPPL